MMTPCRAQLNRSLVPTLCDRAKLFTVRLSGKRAARARRGLSRFVALSLLLVGSPAQAANYTFSHNTTELPPDCRKDGGKGDYSCGTLTLGVNDTITIDTPKPATITFTGALTTGAGNLINTGGLATDLNLVTEGVLTLGANTKLNANVVSTTAAVNLGIGSTVGGNLSGGAGAIALGANSTVGGFISTDAGAVTIGDASTIGGAITTQAGVVTLTTNIKVGGDIRTGAGATACASRTAISPAVSQTLNFAAADGGRKTTAGMTGKVSTIAVAG